MNYFDAVAEAAKEIDISVISEDFYLGNALRHVIVSTSTEPDAFADDVPAIDRIYITIKVYTPAEENMRNMETRFRLALENAGMEDVRKIGASYEDKKRKRCIIFTAEMQAEREE